MTAAASGPAEQPEKGKGALVIGASSLGTMFEWYDFYIYAALAPLFGKLFFPGESPTAGLLLALAVLGDILGTIRLEQEEILKTVRAPQTTDRSDGA